MMFARLTTAPILPGCKAELTRLFNEHVLSAVKAAPGNTAAYLLIDEATNTGLSITLWVTHADGEAFEASGQYGKALASVAHLFAGKPVTTRFDVALWG